MTDGNATAPQQKRDGTGSARRLSRPAHVQERTDVRFGAGILDALEGIRRPSTVEDIANAAGVTRERIRSLLMQGLPVETVGASGYAGPHVVHPGFTPPTALLETIPDGWFEGKALGLKPEYLEEMRKKGFLTAKSRLRQTMYRPTDLCRWTACCVGMDLRERVPEDLPDVDVGRDASLKDVIIGIACEMGDAGMTAKLINVVAGNSDLPGNRLEELTIHLWRQNYLTRSPRPGYEKRMIYRATELAREWRDHRGMQVAGAGDVAAWLQRTSPPQKNAGLPEDAPEAWIMRDGERVSTVTEWCREAIRTPEYVQ